MFAWLLNCSPACLFAMLAYLPACLFACLLVRLLACSPACLFLFWPIYTSQVVSIQNSLMLLNYHIILINSLLFSWIISFFCQLLLFLVCSLFLFMQIFVQLYNYIVNIWNRDLGMHLLYTTWSMNNVQWKTWYMVERIVHCRLQEQLSVAQLWWRIGSRDDQLIDQHLDSQRHRVPVETSWHSVQRYAIDRRSRSNCRRTRWREGGGGDCLRENSLLYLLLMLGTAWLGLSLYNFTKT